MLKIFAFIKKDFLIQISYRVAFILQWLGIFVSVATFYFIAKLFGHGATPYLKEYQTGYFAFVLIGITFSGYLTTAIYSFSRNIREEQMMGTLEAILVTPIKIPVIIISMPLWNFIFTSLSTIMYLLFGVLFFELDLSRMNLIASLIILVLTIISFSGIGIISAAFIMILKRGDPVTWLVSTFSQFFGGVFFPITMLPKGLQVISYFLPITYSLRGFRHAILQGYTLKMLIPEIVMLLSFCVVLLPLSIVIFRYAVKKAKIDGSLTYY